MTLGIVSKTIITIAYCCTVMAKFVKDICAGIVKAVKTRKKKIEV